ncbi:uncharacterized protein LOC119614141 isoform X1 [Lucilia sericata]|uniref:uncharacterized protein LOC119614141 isoform X1 n=1 Tax=Lucilia sericata TaxID=13632 RepID=UPI0018A85D7F|nr:uncharacterized protein LOC119614141 isoform X1 [Lucilia sericata]
MIMMHVLIVKLQNLNPPIVWFMPKYDHKIPPNYGDKFPNTMMNINSIIDVIVYSLEFVWNVCKNFPMLLDNNYQYNDSRLTNKITQFFDMIHKRPLDLQMRSEYHELVHNCLNSEFQEKYGADLRTYIEYCERSEETIEKDTLEKVFYKLLQIIVILNILSTLYDSCLKRRQPVELQNADYYKVNPQQPVSTLLTAFSIRRNYYRLVEPSTSQLGMDLSYLDGIRSVCVILIIAGPCVFHTISSCEKFGNF